MSSLQQTQPTSRAVLFQEDGLTSILSPNSEQELDMEVQRLHDIIRRSLGNFEACPKRRKLDNTPMEEDLEGADAPFRLISWSLPPRPIRLVPTHQSRVRLQRLAEDTVDEAHLRHVRAQEAAVDAHQILTYPPMSNPKTASTTVTLLTGANPSRLPSLLVTTTHPLAAPQGVENKSEHGHVRCCSLVSITDELLCDKGKRKRKRRRYPVRDRPAPAFFRPMQEWGGKSGGYALGWRGSIPTDRPKLRQSARGKMRKGTLGNLTS